MTFSHPLLASLFAVALVSACNHDTANNTASSASVASITESVSASVAATSATTEPVAPTSGLAGTDVSKDDLGGDFTLTDGNGKPFSMSSLKGKAVILSFGFTHCPDVCPTELLTYSDTLKQLGDQAKDVAVVFVSVDPERDTPELIGQYVKQFNPNFIGLTDTGGGAELALAKQIYRIVSAKTEIKSDTVYNVDHSSGAYLLDKNGKAVVFARYGMEAPQIAADLKKILAQ